MTDVLDSLLAEGDPRPAGRPRVRRVRPAGPPARGFRPDIEGLRALAIIAIVAADAGLDRRTGDCGLAVGCVVIGFLTTRTLVANWPITGLRGVTSTVGRQFARVLVPVIAVGAAVVAISWIWLHTAHPNNPINPAPTALQHLHPMGAGPVTGGIAVGALVALLSPEFARLGRRLAELTGAVGLLLVLGSVALPVHYLAGTVAGTGTGIGPGAAAGTGAAAGAALVIAAGTAAPRRIERVLGESLLQCLGRISFPWYLWQWPLLALAPVVSGRPLTWQFRLALIWIAIALAIGSYFLFDQPRRTTSLTTAGIGALVLAVALPALVVLPTSARTDAATVSAAAVAPLDLAVAAGVDLQVAPANLSPSVAAAANDRPISNGTPCHADYPTIDQPACVYGDPNGTPHSGPVRRLARRHVAAGLRRGREAGRIGR